MHALSTRPDPAQESESPSQTIRFDSEQFTDVLAAIGSDTARSILLSVRQQPLTASEIADRVDTSIQNASYHLDRLTHAGLIEVCDTVYSEKGCEMNLYHAVETTLHFKTARPDDIGDP
jgi:DNA-binding transcriptional ArsR family regulator